MCVSCINSDCQSWLCIIRKPSYSNVGIMPSVVQEVLNSSASLKVQILTLVNVLKYVNVAYVLKVFDLSSTTNQYKIIY